MNPDIQKLQEQVAELMAWKAAREAIQLPYPVDDISRLNLRAVSTSGFGSHALTQVVSVPATPTNITVPAAFSGTFLLEGADGRFEVPYF